MANREVFKVGLEILTLSIRLIVSGSLFMSPTPQEMRFSRAVVGSRVVGFQRNFPKMSNLTRKREFIRAFTLTLNIECVNMRRSLGCE